jgi:hypothetical protein
LSGPMSQTAAMACGRKEWSCGVKDFGVTGGQGRKWGKGRGVRVVASELAGGVAEVGVGLVAPCAGMRPGG